ncbi:MAG: hypothetical protein ACOYOQ_16070 [Microthrixaceae bacterium]
MKEAVADGQIEVLAGKRIEDAVGGLGEEGSGSVVVISVSGSDFGAVEVVPDLASVDTSRRVVVIRPVTVGAEFLAAWMSSRPVQERLERRAQGSARGGRSVPAAAILELPADFPDPEVQSRLSGAWKALGRLGEIATLLDRGLSDLRLQLAEPFVGSDADGPAGPD